MEGPSSRGEEQGVVGGCRSDVGAFRLTKEDRVRLPSEYRRMRNEGARYRTPHFNIRMLKNSLGRPRLGMAVGRKSGTACARNRIKRRLREYFRLNRDKMPPETDVVFIAREGAAKLDSHQLTEELGRFFETEC